MLSLAFFHLLALMFLLAIWPFKGISVSLPRILWVRKRREGSLHTPKKQGKDDQGYHCTYQVPRLTTCLAQNTVGRTEITRTHFGINFLGQKRCRTKSPRIFRIFVPNFAPNFAPNFPRKFSGVFVLCFVGNGDQKKFTKNPPPFFNAKFPGKFEEKIHKMFLESR